jgi:hypothetical protein
MPTMALFDRGRPSPSKPTHANGAPPSPSCMTLKQTVSQQEYIISSSFGNPTPLPVHSLHSNIASLEIQTCHHRHPHRSTASLDNVLPSNTSLATTDLKPRLLYLDKPIKATSDIVQPKSTISSITYGPTHFLVPIARKDTALLEFPTPRLHLATPIRYWLPMSYQDCCFSSIGGCFLSFPGFNALLPVSMLQLRIQPTTHKCPHQPFHQHVIPADYETRQFNLLQEGLDLQNKFFELFAEVHQATVVPIPFGLVPTTPTDAPTMAFPTLTDVASLLPLSLAEQLAPTTSNPTPPRYFTSSFPMATFETSASPPPKSTSIKFNPSMFEQPLDLQAHPPHLSPFVPHQLLLRSFETRLFCFPVKSIGIHPAPEPPPGHGHAKVVESLSVTSIIPSCYNLCFWHLVFPMWFSS